MSEERTITARTESELSPILDRIHDRWFESETLRFDVTKRTVCLKSTTVFWRPTDVTKGWLLYRFKLPVFEVSLIIDGATEMNVDDKAQIGGANINSLRFVGDGIDIIGCEPVTVHIKAKNPVVRLEVSKLPVGWENHCSIAKPRILE